MRDPSATPKAPAPKAPAPKAPAPRARRISYRAWCWIVPLLVAAFGGLLRFARLGIPHVLVFDEAYYVRDAWTLLRTGTERAWPGETSDVHMRELFAQGQTDMWLPQGADVSHPPLGKWLIAIGLELFGGAQSSFAWRFSSALAGTVMVLLICRIALHLFHNLTISALAGLFMAVDGIGIVMSRVGMLDVFVAVFTLGALLCLLDHREWARARLEAAHERDVARPGMVVRAERLGEEERRGEGGCEYPDTHGRPVVRLVVASSGPQVTFSWWRLAAFVLLGLSTGVKWSGAYFMAVFAVLSVLWDGYARREVGYESWFAATVAKDGLVTAAWALPVYLATYVACWASWFANPDSYGRDWAATHPGQGASWLPDALNSFIHRHVELMGFHTALDSANVDESDQFMWLVQTDPATMSGFILPDHPAFCSASPGEQCIQATTALGNPLLWWLATACLVLGAVVALVERHGDWRFSVVVAPLLAGWVPWWLFYPDRTTYNTYTIAILPAMVLSLCYVYDWVFHRFGRRAFRLVAGVSGFAIVAVSALFYPLWTSIPVPMSWWERLRWLPSWGLALFRP